MGAFLQLLEQHEDERQRQLAGGIAGASMLTQGVNADAFGRARATAQFLGVPPAVVEANPEEAERQARILKIDQDTAGAPVLRQRYTDADFMKLASDDSGVLSGIETVIRRMFGSPRLRLDPALPPVMRGAQFSDAVRRQMELNPALDPDAARALVSQVTTVDNQSAFAGPARGPAPTASSIMRGLFNADTFRASSRGFAIQSADVLGLDPSTTTRQYETYKARAEGANPQFESDTGRAVYGGVKSLVQNAPGIVLSILTGNPVPGLAMAGGQVYGEAYGKYRARGGTAGQAATGALLEGGAEVATELLPMSFLVSRFGRAGAGEFIKGVLARDFPMEQIATLVQDAVDTAIANPGKTWGDYLRERPEAAYQTAVATLVQSGLLGGAAAIARRLAPREQLAREAEQNAQVLQEMMQLAAASKVRERDAGTFEAFLQSATEDGPLERVFVNLREAQAAGLDLTALAQVAPSAAAQIEQALETGTDLAIPTAELATRLPGSAVQQVLLQHLKTDPGGFSQAGAQAYLQTQGEQVRAEVERVLEQRQADDAFRASVKAVEDNVRQQLAAANRFTEDVNSPYAALWANFFGVQAARLKVTPEDLFARYQPRIVAQTAAGALLDQDVPLRQATRTQQEVERWRAALSRVDGRDMDYAPSLPTPTVLRALGIKDTALAMPSRAMLKIGQTHPDVSLEVIQNLPALLSDPLYAFAHGEGGWNVVIDATTEKGEPLIVGVRDGRVRTITPYNDGEITGWQRLAKNLAAAQGKIYARNEEAPAKAGASAAAPDWTDPMEALLRDRRNVVTRAALVKRYGQGYYQSAFHGSPHDFERFSTDKIGTGEGAQAFGWGLYFAESKGVADNYRRTLSASRMEIDGKPFKPSNHSLDVLVAQHRDGGLAEALRQYIEDNASNPYAGVEDAKQMLDAVRRGAFNAGGTGRLYQVEIPDDVVGRMLLWDKPMSEQPPAVKAALQPFIRQREAALRRQWKSFSAEEIERELKYSLNQDGQQIYEQIGYAQGNGDRGASEYLDSIGIPGIKYLDGQSRNRPLKQIKREFLDQLPEDADFDEVLDLIGTGTFAPANEAVLRALADNDWLGFDYPAQAISAALSRDLANYDASPALRAAVETLLADATYNFVVFNERNVRLTHKDGSPVTAAERREFFQNDGRTEITRGSFNPQTNTVALLQAADLSTFLHESGHFFLEVLADMASMPNAPAEIVADFNAFLKWTGVESAEAWAGMSLEQRRAHHEDFARGFEAYLFEGKAPSIEVQGLFQRFRAWLLNVYRDLAALNIQLTDEIRGVFDRMLATNEQIRTAEDVRGFEALFKNKPDGMTEDEWAVYQLQAGEATQDAIEELQTRSLRDMRWLANAKSRELRRLQKEAKARREEIEAEVRAEVEAMPVYQAMAAIREQRKSDPADRQALADWRAAREAEQTRLQGVIRDQYLDTPEGRAAKGIERGQFLARNKRKMANEVEAMVLQWEQQNPRPRLNIPDADLEALAALHGFTSADHLRRAIEGAQPLREVIEGMADQRMLERYGDLVDERALERAAEEAIHNDARLRFTATEANALQKATGKPAILAKAVRQFAADIIARTRVRDLRPSVYTAAERRAAADAAKAMRENKLEDVAVQKRNQLINGHAAKQALAAQDEAEKIVAYLRGFNRESIYKTLDGDYVDQIHQLLERFDLRTGQSLRAIDKRASLAEWLKAQEEAGLEPEVPPELVNEARRTHFKNLTMEELRGLRDTVAQIEHLGRLKHKLLTAKDQRDYEAVRDTIVASIIANAGGKTADNRTRRTTLDAAVRMFNGYVLEHRKVASLARELDGFTDGGPVWEYIVRTMNDAGDQETTMRAEAAQRLAQLVKPMLEGGRRGGRGIYFEHLKASFNREERLGIALNMGNAGNIQRLLGGEGWTLEQVKPMLDTLTAADWQFVQSVWDFLETYRPLIAAKERRVYGKEPNWVEPQPLQVQTADGKTLNLRGGYFPIKYDPRASAEAASHDDAEAAKQQMRGAYTSATTRRSFTKARAEEVTGRPLMYSTDALFNGVNEIIHDLAWHEWLIDANRLLRSKSISNAIYSRYGAEVHQQFKSAVKDIAAGEFPGTHAFERGMGRLRAGTVVAGMGLNMLNSIINVQGITQSMVRIGTKWTAVGIARYAAGPLQLAREVHGKSEMMAGRARTLNREVNEIQSMVRDKSALRAAADRTMFLPLTLTQQVVDLPTWWGAYQKALDEGNTEDRAVSMADQAVLDAQSGGQVKDLAGIQRGSPMLKLWTTFYGFFNATYNLTVESTKRTDFKDPGQVVRLVGDYLLLWTIPALLGTLLKNLLTDGDWDDEEKLAKKLVNDQIGYLMGMMVGLRDVAGAAQAVTGTSEFNMGYGGPAGARFLGELYKAAQQANQGEADAPLFKALNNIGGILLMYPATQINRTVEGAIALQEGRTKNPLALIAGPPPKQ